MRVSSPIPHKRARIEIIPLIDVMFFLLASFMMVSLSQEGNAVYFDNQIVSDDQVLPKLYELHRANPDIKVSISASLMAMHGDVISVLDKVRSAGITKVGYQIRAAGAPAAQPGAPAAQPGAPTAQPGAPPPPPPPKP